MRAFGLRLGIALGLLFAAPAGQAAGLVPDEERWRWAVSGNAGSDYLHYLRSYPEGRHADEARKRVQASRHGPLARLSTDTAECRQVLQQRVKSMLWQPVGKERMTRYDFSAPDDALLAVPVLVIVPKGQTPETARIEDHVELNLVANRRGECTVMQRWSHGSGLPQSCRCTPLDAQHDFGPPPLAVGVLKDHARLVAGLDACGARLDRGFANELPAKHLQLRIDMGRQLVTGMRARLAQGRTLYPTEQDELQSWEEALPYLVRTNDRHEGSYREHANWLAGRSPTELETYCASFQQRYEDRMTGLLVSSKMRQP